MKNKQIEELLNKLKKCRDYDDEVLLIKQYGATLLLSYIEQLQTNVKDCKQKLVQYENPDDLTLFYMWLDTKAKDKMKQMEAEITNLKQQNSMITKLGEQLQNNRDKALKKLNKYRNRKDHYCLWCMEYIDNADIIHILKGESDE